MKTRHLLAVLAITGGFLFLSACGDDNDTPPPRPTPTNTQPPVPTSTQPPPTFTNTVGPELSPTATATPVPGSPSPTAPMTPGFAVNFTCDVETAYLCDGGPNDGVPCRPLCHLTGLRPDEEVQQLSLCRPDELDFCGSGTCKNAKYFCKGGAMEGAACTPPRLSTDPNPCGEGGRCQNSELAICTELACPTSLRPVAGNTRITATCDANGCRGSLLLRNEEDIYSGFDPVVIAGIGNICVRPVGPDELTCPDGEIDCDGGDLIDYDLIQDHNIGPCTGNEQCIQMCQAYCQNLGRTVADSGCAGFCEGGTRNGLTCGCDRQNIQCSLPECPEGSCVGKDNPEPANRDICGCQCLETGGGPAGAGGVNFQVPAQIIVESDSDPLCGVGPVLITLPPQCIPFTTETMSGILINANNTPGAVIPPANCQQGDTPLAVPCVDGRLVRDGRRVDCEALKTGNISEMDIAGNISFFDSAIGDIEVVLDWFCK